MRAVRVTSLGGPSSVEVLQQPEPQLEPGHVLVDVHAAGVNFPDVLLTKGQYQLRPDPPFTLGSECAGVVREAASGSTFAAGDRVVAFPIFGAFAETALVRESLVFALPDAVSFVAGAALPMNYLTVQFALARRARLQSGETVLVHGAAGGIGTAAVAMAKALGARVIAVVSTDAKGDAARSAGADEVVATDGFLSRVRELTGNRGVDVVVDPVGGDRFTDSLRALAPEGRLLVIGFTAGAIPEVKVNRLLLNNLSVVGVGWGAFWTGDPDYPRAQWQEVLPLLAEGALVPLVGQTYPLAEAAGALSEIDERRALGKVVLTVR